MLTLDHSAPLAPENPFVFLHSAVVLRAANSWSADTLSQALSPTAVLSAALTAVQVYTRSRRVHSGMSDEMVRMAGEQLLPALATGILLTLVLVHYVPAVFWILPGLWQIIFSLGVFSSCRFLPRPMLTAGAWYLFTGLICIALGDDRVLSPWTMGISFGAGQLLVAAILLFTAQEDELED